MPPKYLAVDRDVHYPFHPLHQQSLEVVAWPRPGRLAVTVRQPDGRTPKIPLWRIEPAAAKISLCDQVELTASVRQGLAALHNAHADALASNLEQRNAATNQPRPRTRQRNPVRSDDTPQARTTAVNPDGRSQGRGVAKRKGG